MKQADRKEILFRLDKKEKYTNEELFFADLTPYYSFDNMEGSFFEKIIEYKNDDLRMVHNSKISFTPEQKSMFDKIASQKKCRYAISATTSFGKTTIIKEYIKQFQPNSVVYVVPTNSLADELLADFESLYKQDDYDIIDTSLKNPNKKKIIFIGTQEKLKEISWLKDLQIELFIIDEAYKLTDEVAGFREVVLNRIFIDYMDNVHKYILLLPLVNQIIGLDKFNFEILKTDYSPVEKDFIGIESGEYDDFIVDTVKLNQKDNKNLIYFSSPNTLETFFYDKLFYLESSVDDDWIKRVEKDFHREWFPVIAYKKGLAIHYGPMPKFFQIRMVTLFNKNDNINTILSTSSLIEGVNTPTKNIFIKDDGILEKENRIKYKNLIGRAGRLGITPIGNIFYDNRVQLSFEEANQDWNTLNIRVVVDDNEVLEKINRDEKFKALKQFAGEHELNEKSVNDLLESSSVSIDELRVLISNLKAYLEECKKSFYPNSVPSLIYFYNRCYYKSTKYIYKYNLRLKPKKEWVKILNLSGETIKKQDAEIKKVSAKFLGTLLSATMNMTIRNKNMNSIGAMLEYIVSNNNMNVFETNNSDIISKIIDMMYTGLPYEIMPFLDLIIATDNMFKENEKKLLDEKLSKYLIDMITKYNLRYFGKVDCTDKERKIIKRVFEYGIPYTEIKEFIKYLVDNIPDSFSINHIKEVINLNEDMKKNLDRYFY